MRIVEEVALDPPGLVINLLPHRARLNIDFPAIEFERTGSRLRRTAASRSVIGRGCRPGVTFPVENLLAIKRDSEVVDVFDGLIDLALGQIELLERLRDVREIVSVTTSGPSARNRMPDLP